MKPVALLVAAHPVWNVPPFLNAARLLARHGFSVVVIGYWTEQHSCLERIGPGAWLLRLRLRARRLPWAGPRKALALIEFLVRARAISSRLRPNVLLTFNDPACILQRFSGRTESRRRISWLLEYPELERLPFFPRLLFRYSSSCWQNADILVAPTRERLALHLASRPECGNRRAFVVQNAPLREPSAPIDPDLTSERAKAALAFLASAGPERLRIVYSGAIGNRYGIDRLLRVAARLPGEIQLLLLGPKHPLAEAEAGQALNGAPFPSHIRWIDEIPYRDLPRVLEAAQVGFATYLGDTLNTRFAAPGKLYEYLKNGLVILSDEACCIHPQVRSAGCGVFFSSPVTDQSLRAAIEELLRKKEQVAQMRAASRALFANSLCMEEQIAPLIEELRSLRSADRQSLPDTGRIRPGAIPLPGLPPERRPTG